MVDTVIETTDLRKAYGRVKALSRGMRTKLAVLLALCRGADLLLLDEPTAGLDPAAAEDVLQAIVSQVAQHGVTVFFSSHQITEVEQVADDIAIIDQGRLIVSGSIETLREEFRRIQLVFDDDAPAHVFAAPGVRRVRRDGRVLSVLSSGGTASLLEEARALQPASRFTDKRNNVGDFCRLRRHRAVRSDADRRTPGGESAGQRRDQQAAGRHMDRAPCSRLRAAHVHDDARQYRHRHGDGGHRRRSRHQCAAEDQRSGSDISFEIISARALNAPVTFTRVR
jgi:hypothetical protein